MIRFSNAQAKSLLGALMIIKDHWPADIYRQSSGLVNGGAIDVNDWNLCRDEHHGRIDQISAEELIEQIKAQLRVIDQGPTEVIDRVLEFLNNPFGGNMLSTDRVRLMRHKILTPDEKADLEKAEDKALRCVECGHEFSVDPPEVAIVTHDGEITALRCTNCAGNEALVACATKGCDESVEFGGLHKALSNAPQCAECSRKAEPEPKPNDIRFDVPPNFDELMNAARARPLRHLRPGQRVVIGGGGRVEGRFLRANDAVIAPPPIAEWIEDNE